MLYLRKSCLHDKAEVSACYQASKAFHYPWVYPPENIEIYLADEGRYFLCLENSHKIVGTFCLSGLVRGYFQSAYLGFEVFCPYDSRGYMRKGLDLIIKQAFDTCNLHRLEANIQPTNFASIKLVSGAGFLKEGFSKSYLNIGGQGWKDHERWALLNEVWGS